MTNVTPQAARVCWRAALLPLALAASLGASAAPRGEDDDDGPPVNDMRQLCMLFGNCPQAAADPLDRNGFALRLASGTRLSMNAMPMAPIGRTPPKVVNPPTSSRLEAARSDPGALIGLGNEAALAGRWPEAVERYQAAQRLAKARNDTTAGAAAEANLGVAAAVQGRYPEARERIERALALMGAQRTAPAPSDNPVAAQMAAIQDRIDAMSLASERLAQRINLANLEGQLGRFAQAEAILKDSLDRLSPDEAQTHQRTLMAELMVLYTRAGRAADAQAWRQRAERAAAEPGQRDTTSGGGLVALGGAAAQPAADSVTAEGETQRPSHYAEAAHARLQAQAREREAAGDTAGAVAALSRAALLAAVTATPERERALLAELERLHAAAGADDLAIFFGKRAVNLAQTLRAELGGMDRATRRAYLADKARSYATLARLLIRQGRLPEAEQVLRLLKEDEGQAFRQARADEPRGRIPYTTTEAAALARYDAIVQRTRALERQRAALDDERMFAVRSDVRAEHEKLRRERILAVVDEMLPQYEAIPAQIASQLGPLRNAAAKPAASRTAEERLQVAQFGPMVRSMAQSADNMAAGVRALRRDGRDFVVPLTAADNARLDAALPRLAKLQATYAQLRAALPPDAANAAPAKEMGILGSLLDMGMGRLTKDWEIDREVEDLDAQREKLDAALAAELGRGKPVAEASFDAAGAQALEAPRRTLAALPPGTAALYYLAGDQQLDILLALRDGRRTFKVALPRATLEARIQAFRELLQNPKRDPTAAAKALHEALVAPVEAALQAAKATTLMLSLDGPLRTLPFAALHDGQGWLAERYAIDIYTSAAPAALTAAPAPAWRVAAFGSAAGGAGLPPLRAVRGEVEGIVRDAQRGTQGVLPGTIRLDGAFTAAALRDALRERPPVVHIASHFAFRGGEPADSFLLLGDGSRLTLADLAAPDYRFDRVDLVTLSACDTALAGSDSFGLEVEGLGTLLQGQGAAAVLATLWSVDDDSTAQLMRTLYAQREQRKLTRAQALREAQLALIRGGAAGSGASSQRGASRPAAPGAGAWADDAARPWSHPYHWAPFVLMGNWL